MHVHPAMQWVTANWQEDLATFWKTPMFLLGLHAYLYKALQVWPSVWSWDAWRWEAKHHLEESAEPSQVKRSSKGEKAAMSSRGARAWLLSNQHKHTSYYVQYSGNISCSLRLPSWQSAVGLQEFLPIWQICWGLGLETWMGTLQYNGNCSTSRPRFFVLGSYFLVITLRLIVLQCSHPRPNFPVLSRRARLEEIL